MIGTKTRRGLALVVATAVLFLPFGLAPANAEPDYPPSFYRISADSFTVRVGGKITFTAQTFSAKSPVAVDVSADGAAVGSDTVTANRQGIAVATVTFDTEGVNTVTMSGTADTGDALSLSADVTVTGEDDGTVTPVDNGDDDGNGGSGTGSGSDESTGGSDSAGGVPFLGGGLPRTGGEIAMTALVAAGLVGLGALLVVFTRRRRAS